MLQCSLWYNALFDTATMLSLVHAFFLITHTHTHTHTLAKISLDEFVRIIIRAEDVHVTNAGWLKAAAKIRSELDALTPRSRASVIKYAPKPEKAKKGK